MAYGPILIPATSLIRRCATMNIQAWPRSSHAIFICIAMVLQRCLINRKPHQWRGPTMFADQRQHNRRMIIGVEVRPVHGNNNVWTLPDHIRNREAPSLLRSGRIDNDSMSSPDPGHERGIVKEL